MSRAFGLRRCSARGRRTICSIDRVPSERSGGIRGDCRCRAHAGATAQPGACLEQQGRGRTGLILEIFGERARTAEGELQVELAALTYQRSRLVRSWTHLERRRFRLRWRSGGSQIETDRRLIRDRIARLKRELQRVRRTREHRRARRRVPYPIIALVGYTNAGKSTLFNRLTHSGVVTRDQLFATLDPTMRALDLPSGAG